MPMSPITVRRILRGQRVLVVEDEALVAMLVEDALLDAGAEVVGPVASVADALRATDAAMAEGGLSAVVLDCNLQGEVARPVADHLARLGVPFLVATGYAEGQVGLGHPDAPTIRKPFDPDRMADVVAMLIRSRGLDHAA